MSVKTIEVWEGEWVDLPEKSIGEIINAEYGQTNAWLGLGGIFNPLAGGELGVNRMVDVTDKVREFVREDRSINFQVNNSNIGFDPCGGILKKIVIKYKEFVEPEVIYEEGKEDILENVNSNELYHNGGYAAYIAIDEYQNTNNLKCCVNDAKLLENFLSKQGYLTLGEILTNNNATKKNIEGFLDKVSQFLKDKKESSFVLYIAGHGKKTDTGGNFLCHDYSPKNMISTSIDYEVFNDLSKSFSSKHQLFIVDACFSGTLIKNSLRNAPWNNNFLHKKGLHAITSVENSGKAIENGENGIFTKSFVEILTEQLNKKDFIRITELEGLLKEKINEKIKGLNIKPNTHRLPKFGRLLDKVNSLDDIHEKIDVNGEIIFFKNELLPDNILTRGTFRYNWD